MGGEAKIDPTKLAPMWEFIGLHDQIEILLNRVAELTRERDAIALMWFRELEDDPEGEERLYDLVGGAIYGPIDDATAIEAARKAAGLKGGPR